MERIVATVFLVSFLHILMFATASAAATEAGNCTVNSDNQTACCDSHQCMFYTCTSTNNTVTGHCVNRTVEMPTCDTEPDKQEMICGMPVNCTNFANNETECCHQNGACLFYSCKTTETVTFCEDNSTDTAPTCPSGGNITVGCEASHSTTPSPTSTPKTATCSDYMTDEAACCNATINCTFYNCTGTGDQPVTPHCVAESEQPSCPGGNVSQGCQGSSTTTTTTTGSPTSHSPTSPNGTLTTASPSTGGDSGGGFDAASFIGGIVLCGGLIAIGYFGLKFYRARQERNYHTL